jgi:hypothetical protein
LAEVATAISGLPAECCSVLVLVPESKAVPAARLAGQHPAPESKELVALRSANVPFVLAEMDPLDQSLASAAMLAGGDAGSNRGGIRAWRLWRACVSPSSVGADSGSRRPALGGDMRVIGLGVVCWNTGEGQQRDDEYCSLLGE